MRRLLLCGVATGYRLLPVALVLPSAVLLALRWKIRADVVALALVALLSFTFFARNSTTESAASSGRSNSGRLGLMRQAARAFIENPVTGVGVGQLRMVAGDESPYPWGHADKRERTTHRQVNNQCLQLLAEFGLSGAAWFFALAWGYFRTNAIGTWEARTRLAAGSGVLLLGVTECTFGTSFNLTGNIVLGFLIGQSLPGEVAPEAPQTLARDARG